MTGEFRIIWNLVGTVISTLNRVSFPLKRDTEKIVCFDPSKGTDNLGDYIIMRYCSKILHDLFENYEYTSVLYQ